MTATAAIAVTATSTGSGGNAVTDVACDNVNGNSFVQDGNTVLILRNTDASSHTVTFTYPGTVDGQSIPNKVITVNATSNLVLGPGLPPFQGLYPGNVVTFTANSNLVKFNLINHQ